MKNMKNVNSLIERWVKKKPAKVDPKLALTEEEFSQTLSSPKSDDMRQPGQDMEPENKTASMVKKKSTKVKKKSTKVKKSPERKKRVEGDHLVTSGNSSENSNSTSVTSEDQGVGLSPDCDFGLPTLFKCGHTNYKHHGITEDSPLQVEARAEEYCCQALREATLNAWRLNPNMVNRRRAQLAVNWRVRGLYEPVPEAMRRTQEKDKGNGWPGLCCDPATGLYIGGLGNNCRHYNDAPNRCVVHASKRVVEFSDEE